MILFLLKDPIRRMLQNLLNAGVRARIHVLDGGATKDDLFTGLQQS